MKFLSQIGKAILTGAGYVARFEGLIPASVSNSVPGLVKIEDDISKIANIIIDVEAMGQALSITGPDKLKAAGPLVSQIILKSSILVNHEIADQALFTKGCASIGSGFADVLNSLKSKV